MTERLPSSLPDITPRQREVAGYIAQGLTNEEIATRLGITHDGAKYHVSELLSRLGLQRREQVAEWYRATPAPRRQLRGLLAIPLLKPALGIGGAALIALLLVVTLTSNTIRGGGNPTHAEAPTGPLPEEGWDISLSPDYRDTDFVVAMQRVSLTTNSAGDRVARIDLIDPAMGLTAATVRVGPPSTATASAVGAAIRTDARELVVYFGDDDPARQEHRLLVFDLAADLALKYTIPIPRPMLGRLGHLPLPLMADGRELVLNHLVHNPTEPHLFSTFLTIVDLDHATVETIEMEQGCSYGTLFARDDGAILIQGFNRCQYEVLLMSNTYDILQHWRWDYMGAHNSFNITANFLTTDDLLARIRRTGELEVLGRSGDTTEYPSLWSGGIGHQGVHLPGDRIATRVYYRPATPTTPYRTELVIFNTRTLEVEHRLQTDVPTTSYQLRPDGGGIWALRLDGRIDSIDWNGHTTTIPHVRLDPNLLVMEPNVSAIRLIEW